MTSMPFLLFVLSFIWVWGTLAVIFSMLRKAFLIQARMADEIQQLTTEVRQLTTQMNEESR